MLIQQKLVNKKRSIGAKISSIYEVGDSIIFEMPFDEDSKNAFLYECPPSLFLDAPEDSTLQIQGFVRAKRFEQNDSIATFTIEILTLSRTDIAILMEEKGIQNEISLPAYDLYIKNNDD